MPKRGKKYIEALKKIDRKKLYEPEEAMSAVKEISYANFDETIEAAVRLGVDPRHADQQVRGAVVLPHGTGKTRTVIVFAQDDKAKEALNAGADYAGSDDLIESIQNGWLDFDVAIATPDMMSSVGKLGRILGPRGLMPNPKTGTVTFEIDKAVREAKAGKIQYRVEKTGIIHAPIGKVSFEPEQLAENLRTLTDQLKRVKPAAAKGQYIRGVAVATTMGPGIKVNHYRV